MLKVNVIIGSQMSNFYAPVTIVSGRWGGHYVLLISICPYVCPSVSCQKEYEVASLCNLEFSSNQFETFHRCCKQMNI